MQYRPQRPVKPYDRVPANGYAIAAGLQHEVRHRPPGPPVDCPDDGGRCPLDGGLGDEQRVKFGASAHGRAMRGLRGLWASASGLPERREGRGVESTRLPAPLEKIGKRPETLTIEPPLPPGDGIGEVQGDVARDPFERDVLHYCHLTNKPQFTGATGGLYTLPASALLLVTQGIAPS